MTYLSTSLIVTGAHERYAPFVKRWWQSVLDMQPRPDHIIAVIDQADSTNLQKTLTSEISTNVIILDEPYSVNYINAGFRAAATKWVSFCGLDDMMMPQAYQNIAEAGDADIIVSTILLSNGSQWQGTWNPNALQHSNTLPAHSPFVKQLFTDVGGLPDVRWSDWGFWLKCAKRGVKTHQGAYPVAWFDMGDTHETASGINVDAQTRYVADQEIAQFIEKLANV